MNLEKKQLRKSIMQLRDKISSEEKQRLDEAIFNNIINSKYYKKATMIFIFVSYLSEVDTKPIIIKALADNKIVCVPKIKSKEAGMELYIINGLMDLQEGFHGILEPKDYCKKVIMNDVGEDTNLNGAGKSEYCDNGDSDSDSDSDVDVDVDDGKRKGNCNDSYNGNKLDLIIMPGVAFSMQGGRIGYGGGFYDRFLVNLKRDVKKIAVAYELQILENIPMDSHDARIDGIITEKQTTIF